MDPSPILITYQLTSPDGRTRTFELRFDPDSFELDLPETQQPPPWAKLDHQQCHHCPLNTADTEFCPLAASINPLVEFARDLPSYDAMVVDVTTHERTYRMETTAQRAISSLMGLIIPASGCPLTECLRPLARFHVPNASQEETMARVMSFYMLSTYLANKDAKRPNDVDFGKLKRIYNDLHTINRYMAERLKHVCAADSTLNAIVILDTFTMFLPLEIDDSLKQVKSLVEPMIVKLEALPEDD